MDSRTLTAALAATYIRTGKALLRVVLSIF
jgi:hypothetical protein